MAAFKISSPPTFQSVVYEYMPTARRLSTQHQPGEPADQHGGPQIAYHQSFPPGIHLVCVCNNYTILQLDKGMINIAQQCSSNERQVQHRYSVYRGSLPPYAVATEGPAGMSDKPASPDKPWGVRFELCTEAEPLRKSIATSWHNVVKQMALYSSAN